MAWITLSADDLNEYLPALQLKALRTKALAAGQADPMPSFIAEVAAQVRNTIASAGYPLEATANSFPAVLKTAVAFLVIGLAQARIPGLSLTTEQNAQIDSAKAILNKILAREVAIEAPVVPDTTIHAPTSSVRVVSARGKTERVSGKDLRRL